MFAVVQSGGKQYKVTKGDLIKLEKLEAQEGTSIQLDNVLLFNDGQNTIVGSPLVEGATVKAEIVKQARDEKIVIFKKKRRQNYRRKNGHRQYITLARVTDISVGAGKKTLKTGTGE